MYPDVFSIGNFQLHSYGLLLTISFLAGIYWGIRRAKKYGIPPQFISDLSMILIISGLLGARLLYVVYHLDEFRGRWLDIVNPIQSTGQIGIAGLTLLGGFLLAIASSVAWCRWKRISFLTVADILSPSLALGIGISRIGCFLNGCCFGHPSELSCAVHYPAGSRVAMLFPGQAVHPSQLYESLGAFCIVGLLLWIEKRSIEAGRLFGWFLSLYAVLRFTDDLTRYYEPAMTVHTGVMDFSVNQLICFGLAICGVYLVKFHHAQ